jgi:hypothetical protein
MVFVVVRQEAGPRERWPKTPKGELKNRSKKAKRPSQKTGIMKAKKYSTYSFSG